MLSHFVQASAALLPDRAGFLIGFFGNLLIRYPTDVVIQQEVAARITHVFDVIQYLIWAWQPVCII